MASPEIELYFSERGVVVHGGERVSDASFDTPRFAAIIAPWAGVRAVSLVDPWPRCQLTLHTHGSTQNVGLGVEPFDAQRMEAHLAAFVAEAERRGVPVRRGWLARPEVCWEPVDRFPAEALASAPAGGYRAQLGERVLAHRPAMHRHRVPAMGAFTGAYLGFFAVVPSLVPAAPLLIVPALAVCAAAGAAAGALLDRLPPRGPTHVRRHPEVAITTEHVWARLRGRAYRVPLATLAARLDTAHRKDGTPFQRHYVFGRAAALELEIRPGCPVEALLGARLATAQGD
jgi:hypothetical protein